MQPLALARFFTLEQGHQNALRRKNSGTQISNRNAHTHRALLGQTGDRHQAAHALCNLVKTRPCSQRAGLAKARDAGVHQTGVVFLQALVIDAQAELDIGAEVLNHHIGLGDQLLEQRNALGLFEVEGDRALVAVGVLVVRALLPAQRVVAAHVLGHLHLHHIGTPVGQLAAGRGASSDLGQIDHSETRECGRSRLVRHGGVPCGRRSKNGQVQRPVAVSKCELHKTKCQHFGEIVDTLATESA